MARKQPPKNRGGYKYAERNEFFHHWKLGLCLSLILHFHLCTGAKKCVLRTPNESGHSTCQNVWIYESTFYTFKCWNVPYYKYYFTWFVDFFSCCCFLSKVGGKLHLFRWLCARAFIEEVCYKLGEAFQTWMKEKLWINSRTKE